MIQTNWLAHTQIDTCGFSDTIDKIVENKEPIDLFPKSTRGFKSNQYNFKGDDFIMLDDIINTIKNQLHNIDYLKGKKIEPSLGWTVYGEHHGYHEVHNHLNRGLPYDISTVLYLKTPSITGYTNKGQFYYFLLDNDEIKYHELEPVEGMLVIMPTRTLHGSYPQPRGLRHTLNFDFKVSDEN